MRYLIWLLDILCEKLNKIFYILNQISFIGYKISYILNQISNKSLIFYIRYLMYKISMLHKKDILHIISDILFKISDI